MGLIDDKQPDQAVDSTMDSREYATPDDEFRPPLPPQPRGTVGVPGSRNVLPPTGLLRLTPTEI